MKFELIKSPNTDKKYRGIFTDKDGKVINVDFGQRGYEDLTSHKNVLRRARYIARHKAREDWKNPMSAGALSRWILWETSDIQKNVKIFKDKFNLE